MPDAALRKDHAVVLFDGVCNLCNAAVNFLIDHDPDVQFKLGALQEDVAKPYLRRFGLSPHHLDSLVLIDGGRLYQRSDAALRIARRLGLPWSLVYAFIVVPRPIRDAVYDVIATNRYQWFGTRDSCRLPTPELQAHFL